MADARRRIRERVGLDASILADRAATITINTLNQGGSYAEGGTYQMACMREVSPACRVRDPPASIPHSYSPFHAVLLSMKDSTGSMDRAYAAAGRSALRCLVLPEKEKER